MADVRAAEAAALARQPDGALMARAAMGLAVAVRDLLRDRRGAVRGARVVVLAGAGNNGGDALHAAARLARRGAWTTAVLLAPAAAHRGGLAALRAAGGRVLDAADPAATAAVRDADVVLDGIVGIGGSGGLRPRAAELVAAAGEGSAAVVAVDLPSGVDPDTGGVVGAVVRADLTVTFGCLKPGLLVGEGRRCAGRVRLVDIGLLPDLLRGPAPAVVAYGEEDLPGLLPRPRATDDKYRRGVLGVLAGSDRYTGAAVLTVGGALRTGVGMVRLVSVPEVVHLVRHAWPSAVCTAVPGGATGSVADPAAVAQAGRVQAWAVGPGLGVGDDAAAVVRAALAQPVPVLLDADALTVLGRLLAADPDVVRRRPAATLLTPHDGEFARLFGVPADEDRIAGTVAAAVRCGATVLRKGDATLVADPDGTVLVNRTGSAYLASAGSGDVLTGMAGALLACGLPAQAAGATAAWLHGRAAGRLSGGCSADLPDAVARVLEEVGR